ncbi:unnamed protein product [Moneuplotes crassus]|uniref:Uncharacterized protein n=1 Tax=Euplotes crassus TaxID=5936 RepID=A0AAD1X500_EUPCR|nr:unnamed protein product [Moneuplotes crassus]
MRSKVVQPKKINIKLPKINRRLNNSLRVVQNEYEEDKQTLGDLDSQSSLIARRIIGKNKSSKGTMAGNSFDMADKMIQKYSVILSSSSNISGRRSEARTELRDPNYSMRHQKSEAPSDLLWGEARGKKSLGIKNIELFRNNGMDEQWQCKKETIIDRSKKLMLHNQPSLHDGKGGNNFKVLKDVGLKETLSSSPNPLHRNRKSLVP